MNAGLDIIMRTRPWSEGGGQILWRQHIALADRVVGPTVVTFDAPMIVDQVVFEVTNLPADQSVYIKNLEDTIEKIRAVLGDEDEDRWPNG